MRRTSSIDATILLAAFALSVSARGEAAANTSLDDCATPTEVRFMQGRTSASFTDVVLRGGARCYVVAAREGQTLRVTPAGRSSANAAILVFRPGWGYHAVYGHRMMDGSALPGAGRDDEATSVRAQVPESGRYLVEVAPARGDAAGYTITIGVR